MIAFHSILPEIAEREVRCIHLQSVPGQTPTSGLSVGEYAFVEFYCDDLNCECRRVFIQVIARFNRDRVLASINYGWEKESFYRKSMVYNPQGARDVVRGALDPINQQSEWSEELLELFRTHVLDEPYRLRLQRHYQLARDELRRRQNSSGSSAASAVGKVPTDLSTPRAAAQGIPAPRLERFNEVATLIEQFGEKHLDAELTGFVIELWSRVCRRKATDCLRGNPSVWAASVTHVIARMNFLFDRSQPIHVTFGVVCDFFHANKTTVGGRATEIERSLRLQQHSEPGLCRKEFLETFTTVRGPNGMVLSVSVAKEMGYLPPDARPEDLL